MSASLNPALPTAQPVLSWRADVSERRYVLIFGALVLLVTTLPYVIGFSTAGKNAAFSGFVFGVEDGNTYIAKMLTGWAGSWVFRSPYTAYPQQGLPFFYFPYLLLGKLASPPALHIQLVVLYQLFRLAGGALMILATYDFLARFIKGIGWRRLGLALILLGGGLGWLLVILGRADWLNFLPLDFYSPEAFGFLSLFGLPHMATARALMLWALLAYLDLSELGFKPDRQLAGEGKPFMRTAARLGGLWLLAGVFNPLSLALIGAVILVHLIGLAGCRLWLHAHVGAVQPTGLFGESEPSSPGLLGLRISSRSLNFWIALICAGLLPGIYLAYNVAVSRWDAYASLWTLQNINRSPNFVHFILAYGLLFPFVLSGGRRLLREDFHSGWLVAGWAVGFPLLAYAPLDLQRRLIDGVWVAWCVLALAALDAPSKASAGLASKSVSWRLAPFVLVFPSTLFLLIGGYIASVRLVAPIFLPADEVAVFESLQTPADKNEVVISAFETGNAFPAWAPVRVLAGHGPESIHLAEMLPQVTAFYQANTPEAQRLGLIQEFGVRYVFWGPAERRLGDWQPAAVSYLQETAHQGEYFLYEVKGFQP